MNKIIKTVLLIAGVILLAFGIYALEIPEDKISIGDLGLIESQDNTNAYITIALGVVAVTLSLLKEKGKNV